MIIPRDDIIIHQAFVSRLRSPQEALDATGCRQYTDRQVVDAMPKGEGDRVVLSFFQPDMTMRCGQLSDDELESEFEKRGLKPADPISIASYNEENQGFSSEMTHGTHWKDGEGKWCHIMFRHEGGEYVVYVGSGPTTWQQSCWIVGVDK